MTAKNFGPHKSLTLEFKEGLTLVYGPNGAGKSTAIVETVSWAVWGALVRQGAARDPDLPPTQPTSVELVFEHNGVVYKVWRQTNGKRTQFEWSRVPEPPTHFETNTKAQAALEAEVGDHALWVATSVFSMDDAAMFSEAGDAARKKLLERLLGLGVLDVAAAEARNDAAAKQKQLVQIQRQLAQVRGATSVSEEAVSRLEALTPPSGPAPDWSGHDRQIWELQTRHQHLSRELQTAQFEADQARRQRTRTVNGRCYACNQEIPAALLNEQHEHVVAAETAAREAEARLRPELDRVGQEMQHLQLELQNLRAQASQHLALSKVAAELAGAEEQLAQLVMQRLQLEQHESLVTDSLEVAQHVARILGPRGVRSAILQKSLSALTELANTYLSWLSPKITVEIRPVPGNDGQVTFDLVVTGAGGRAYGGASGGERRRINVALLLALSQLRRSDFIVADDLFDAVDSAGAEAAVRLLADISTRTSVVVVTHDQNSELIRQLSGVATSTITFP